MNFCFGAVSKNVVDSVIQFSLENKTKQFIFIPSRRQIEHNGGYCNNWTTKQFCEYVKSKNPDIFIERDHGGPGQGSALDDGYESLAEDCKYMDIIHIDPWKQYPDLLEGIQKTVEMIQFCYIRNPNLFYEIATEESIRPFTINELETLLQALQLQLSPEEYSKIKFLVIQCGTKLFECQNTGKYDKLKLNAMLSLANKYSMTAKEHNGDWVNMDVINQKYAQGLKNINISPEMAEIENCCILNYLKSHPDLHNTVYDICIKSQKWRKWVSPDFDFENKRDEIIRITCHYVFSFPEFESIKSRLVGIDEMIKTQIKLKLFELYKVYYERTSCVFCNSSECYPIFDENRVSTMSLALSEVPPTFSYLMPYNVLRCSQCNTFQNKYLGDLSIVYGKNHIDNYGSTKNRKHDQFSKFIIENTNVQGIIEIGACSNALSDAILEQRNMNYTIIEPAFAGNADKITVIPDFLENVEISSLCANVIIMSDVFEHFYDPLTVLRKLQLSENIEFLYLSHPDFDYAVQNNIDMFLNFEHTFLIEHQALFQIFKNNGFLLTRQHNYENNSLFLEFKRTADSITCSNYSSNIGADPERQALARRVGVATFSGDNPLDCHRQNGFNEQVSRHISNEIQCVKNMNSLMAQNDAKKYYVWPASIHSIQLFTFGLNYHQLEGILDNSPNKIGKYLHTYGLLCNSLNLTLETCCENTVIFICNTGPYIKEINLLNTKATVLFLNEMM